MLYSKWMVENNRFISVITNVQYTDKRIKCDECNKTFLSKKNCVALKLHKKNKHEKFNCKDCNETSMTLLSYSSHRKICKTSKNMMNIKFLLN